MSDSVLIARLRDRRASVGIAQSALAEQVGVSRQTLSALEAGRQVPSTLLALQLARALRCSVDDLFQLSGGAVVQARLAGDVPATRRVVVGRVDGRLVAHALDDERQAADGLVVGGQPDSDATIELSCEPADVEDHLLVAGCAPLLGVLADRLNRRYRDLRATWIPATSARALELLSAGLVHIAGVHLADSNDPDAHLRAARKVVPGRRATVLNLAQWCEGLVVAGGNPLGLGEGSSLLRPDLRYAMRNEGAAAQALFDRLLHEAGGDPTSAASHARRASGHREVAQLVRWDVADVGVAIEAAAMSESLDFIPVTEERFDLVVPSDRLGLPAVERFFDLIDRPAFRAEAAGLPGYDLSLSGDLTTVDPVGTTP